LRAERARFFGVELTALRQMALHFYILRVGKQQKIYFCPNQQKNFMEKGCLMYSGDNGLLSGLALAYQKLLASG
jgi:hypothetical protein